MRLEDLAIGSAAQYPDALAVSGPDGRLDYRTLDARAAHLASRLRELGVRRGDRVALWLEKSARAVAAMQAVLRAGAAYVPIDPNAPTARVRALLGDCTPAALITTDERTDRLTAAAVPLPPVLGPEDVSSPVVTEDEPPTDPEDPAYILYTSGSTGTPKGVVVSHRAALAFVDWAGDLLTVTSEDRLANHAPFQFDLSVFDLYAAFRAGASVHIVPDGTPARALLDFLHRQEISIWYSVPSALVLMLDYGRTAQAEPPSALRAVLFAGEVFPIGHLRRLRERWPSPELYNFYGPTETNVCTYHRVEHIPTDRDRPVPIGTAACGNRVWAVRADGLEARPGELGELLVEGPTVMLGYHGRSRPAGQPYATGDLVRVLARGAFEYIGRRDQQVKVRGHRVEVGEIEAALLTHPGIADAAVVVAGSGPHARLIAHLVPRGADGPTLLDVKRFLAERLPRYLIVDGIRRIAELPRTPNGKVDRRALEDRTPNRELPHVEVKPLSLQAVLPVGALRRGSRQFAVAEPGPQLAVESSRGPGRPSPRKPPSGAAMTAIPRTPGSTDRTND